MFNVVIVINVFVNSAIGIIKIYELNATSKNLNAGSQCPVGEIVKT